MGGEMKYCDLSVNIVVKQKISFKCHYFWIRLYFSYSQIKLISARYFQSSSNLLPLYYLDL